MKQSINSGAGDIVFTGIGMITALGHGIDANLEGIDQPVIRKDRDCYKVKDFNPAPFLSDRKVVKAVAPRDVLGLVAIESCAKDAGLGKQNISPERTGLYVGAAPSGIPDNQNYAEGVEASRDHFGVLNEAEFGVNFRSASPTTLLTGLPNNVLCYGSKALDARGPNSNYTAMETSSLIAIISAARAMRLGRLDCAFAGGYSAHTDDVISASLTRRGLLRSDSASDGTVMAEGAAFVSMETRQTAVARGAQIMGTFLAGGIASDCSWPLSNSHDTTVLEGLITDVLSNAGVDKDTVQAVCLSGSGISALDANEFTAVKNVFGSQGTGRPTSSIPTCLTLGHLWGNLMEAGGVADIAAMGRFFKVGLTPDTLRVQGQASQRDISEGSKVALIVRSSMSGEFGCLLVGYDSPV